MDKSAYYKQLHEALGKEFGIPPKPISYIRSISIHHGLRRKDLIALVEEKLTYPHRGPNNYKKVKTRGSKKEFYINMRNFLLTITDGQFEHICTFEL